MARQRNYQREYQARVQRAKAKGFKSYYQERHTKEVARDKLKAIRREVEASGGTYIEPTIEEKSQATQDALNYALMPGAARDLITAIEAHSSRDFSQIMDELRGLSGKDFWRRLREMY